MKPEELEEWRRQIDEAVQQDQLHRQATDQRLDAFERSLSENTAVTKQTQSNTEEMFQILQSWQAAMRVLGWIGKAAKPLSYIIGLVTAVVVFWRTLKGGS